MSASPATQDPDLLRRLQRDAEARDAYDRALELAGSPEETSFLQRRRDALPG